MNWNRKKPGVAFWATVVVVVALALYPLSFGPACWVADHYCDSHPALQRTAISAYRPLAIIAVRIPGDMRTPLVAYGEWGSPVSFWTTARIVILTAMVELHE